VEHGMKQILITMIAGAMYVGLPILFTFMMGWVGYRMMGDVNAFAGKLSNSTQQAGGSGGALSRRAGSAVLGGGSPGKKV